MLHWFSYPPFLSLSLFFFSPHLPSSVSEQQQKPEVVETYLMLHYSHNPQPVVVRFYYEMMTVSKTRGKRADSLTILKPSVV